jgi:hypothetical protein
MRCGSLLSSHSGVPPRELGEMRGWSYSSYEVALNKLHETVKYIAGDSKYLARRADCCKWYEKVRYSIILGK